VATTKDITKKKLPVFTPARCKQCGICSHFCPVEAIGVHDDGTPFLARPEACTSCGLCEDMCPDWAICLTTPGTTEPSQSTPKKGPWTK
jgi:MinD superfamily P-loop ATPase